MLACLKLILTTPFLFLAVHGLPSSPAPPPLTKEQCMSIERNNSIRRTAKVVNVAETNPAYLHCPVPHGSENEVAWHRLADEALLTAGSVSFTSDVRFQISPKRHVRDWVLIVRRVQLADSGCYLCEINTEPSSTVYPVYLNVYPLKEEVPGAKVVPKQTAKLMVTMENGALFLNCTLQGYLGDPHQATVIWTKDSDRLDMSDKSKYATHYEVTDNQITFTMRIDMVSSVDDGQYACEGENMPRASQMVHLNSATAFVPNLLPFILIVCIHILCT